MQVIYKNAIDAIDLLRQNVVEEQTKAEFFSELKTERLNAYSAIFCALDLVRDLCLQANENWERKGTDHFICPYVDDDGNICKGIR